MRSEAMSLWLPETLPVQLRKFFPFELIALPGRVVKTEMPGAQRWAVKLKQASTLKDPRAACACDGR
jgi:hypothetical protein